MQNLYQKSEIHSTENCLKNFAEVDRIFNTFGLTGNIKFAIFELLASILHLGNIEFGNDSNGQAEILESFEKNIEFASKLMKVPSDNLRTVLLFKSMKDRESEIM